MNGLWGWLLLPVWLLIELLITVGLFLSGVLFMSLISLRECLSNCATIRKNRCAARVLLSGLRSSASARVARYIGFTRRG